ncbi:MAG: hypothetical protein ACQSGP_21745 [Frankia sp.]
MWFLLIPPVAVMFALLWLALTSRPDRRPGPGATMERYRRTMDALARPLDDPASDRERPNRHSFPHRH